ARMLGSAPGQGAVVTDVREGSPADEAGLKTGDVIVAVNGRPVLSDNDIYNAEGIATVGSTLELKVQREGKPLTVSAKLAAEHVASVDGASLDPRLAGTVLTDANERLRRQDLTGVTIGSVTAGSRAGNAGLKSGDLIAGVNQVQIGGVKDLRALLAK